MNKNNIEKNSFDEVTDFLFFSLKAFKESFKFAFSFKTIWICSIISPVIGLLTKDLVLACESLKLAGLMTIIGLVTRQQPFPKLSSAIKKFIKALPLKFKAKSELAKEKTKILEKEPQHNPINADKFVTDIKKDIEDILKVKYPGYSEDILALRDLALRFINAKKELGETSESVVLFSSDWLREQLDIESRFKERIKIHLDQQKNMQIIKQIDKLIENEIIRTTPDVTEPSKNSFDIELKL